LKHMVLLSQAINPDFLKVITSALPDTKITVLTGSNVTSDDACVNIVKTVAHNPKSLISRFKNWWKYTRQASVWISQNKNDIDLFFATTNPPLVVFLLNKVYRKYKKPYIILIYDIYPDIIERVMGNPFVKIITLLWRKTNIKAYKNAEKVITIGQSMASLIKKSHKLENDIEVFPIIVNCDEIKPIAKKENQFLTKKGLETKFAVIYSGNIGQGHDIDVFLESSKYLAKHKDITYIIMGSGARLPSVRERVLHENLENVFLLDYLPREDFIYALSSGDVGFVSQTKKTCDLMIPSKSYSYMASGTAIIGLSDGNDDLSELIEKWSCGVITPFGDAKALADAILEMYRHRDLLARYKYNALKGAVEGHSTGVAVYMYRRLFEDINFLN